MTSSNVCRFCGAYARSDQLVKYGVRHYAHHGCYLDAGKTLADLRPWQALEFPWRLILDRNLTAEVEAIAARQKEPAR